MNATEEIATKIHEEVVNVKKVQAALLIEVIENKKEIKNLSSKFNFYVSQHQKSKWWKRIIGFMISSGFGMFALEIVEKFNFFVYHFK